MVSFGHCQERDAVPGTSCAWDSITVLAVSERRKVYKGGEGPSPVNAVIGAMSCVAVKAPYSMHSEIFENVLTNAYVPTAFPVGSPGKLLGVLCPVVPSHRYSKGNRLR